MKISAVIIVKNEENNIVDCAKCLSFVDEIIVVDDYSTDQTVSVLNKLSNKKLTIYQRKLNNDFANQRNFGLSKAKSDFVLFVDVDERIPEKLAFEILSQVNSNTFDGFYIKRTDFFWNRQLKYGEVGNIKILRLARKGRGEFIGKVHEVWKIRGRVGYLKHSIYHYPHKTVKSFLKQINFYTDIRANELYEQRRKANLFSIILYPKVKFIVNYFFRLGFMDGVPGLMMALMMSLHSFLVRGKLWLLWNKNE